MYGSLIRACTVSLRSPIDGVKVLVLDGSRNMADMVTVGEQGALIGVGDLKWVVTRRRAYHRAASSREHRFISEITATAIIITASYSRLHVCLTSPFHYRATDLRHPLTHFPPLDRNRIQCQDYLGSRDSFSAASELKND